MNCQPIKIAVFQQQVTSFFVEFHRNTLPRIPFWLQILPCLKGKSAGLAIVDHSVGINIIFELIFLRREQLN